MKIELLTGILLFIRKNIYFRKNHGDIEDRIRKLESFKYMTIGIGFLVGILLSSLIQWVMKTLIN